ncbi:unnamed protein product, partial [Brenthis ino]
MESSGWVRAMLRRYCFLGGRAILKLPPPIRLIYTSGYTICGNGRETNVTHWVGPTAAAARAAEAYKRAAPANGLQRDPEKDASLLPAQRETQSK